MVSQSVWLSTPPQLLPANPLSPVYYGQEQHLSGAFNPLNREALWLSEYNTDAPLYKLVSSLNAIRSHAFSAEDTYGSYVGFTFYHDEHTMAMRKGFDGSQVITVLTNGGENATSTTLNLKNTGFKAGDKVTEILTCEEQTTQSDGSINVVMSRGAPNVFYPSAGLQGSKVCQKGSSSSGGGGSGSGSGSSGSSKTGAAASSRTFENSILAFTAILSLWIPFLFL
jgi:alpha-amylase